MHIFYFYAPTCVEVTLNDRALPRCVTWQRSRMTLTERVHNTVAAYGQPSGTPIDLRTMVARIGTTRPFTCPPKRYSDCRFSGAAARSFTGQAIG